MSAAASAEMIETPPVLNFEEIDYKEIEVEEVSAGPAAGWPLPTHTRPRSPGAACRRAGREPGWPPRAAGVAVPPQAEGAAGAPWVSRDTPPHRSVPAPGAVGFSAGCCSGWHRRTKAVWLGAEVPAYFCQPWCCAGEEGGGGT